MISLRNKFPENFWVDYKPFLSFNLIQSMGDIFHVNCKQPHPTVFNLGSGQGDVSEELQFRYPEYQFIDLDIAAVQKEDTLSTRFARADLHNIPVKSAKADMVVSFFVMVYLKDIHQVLDETKRIMKKKAKGVFLMHTPFSWNISRYLSNRIPELEKELEFLKDAYQSVRLLKKPIDMADFCDGDILNRQKIIDLSRFFQTTGMHQMFHSRREVKECFMQHGFKNISISLSTLDSPVEETQYPESTEHHGWLVQFYK